MPVSREYREFALEQLGRVLPVTSRAMFGGVGVYADGLFFALMDVDALYLKVDDGNRADFEAAGMPPFDPYGDGKHVMQYYALPADALEDAERLRPWVEGALEAARRKRKTKR